MESLKDKKNITLEDLAMNDFEVRSKEDLDVVIKNKPQRLVLTGKIAEDYLEKQKKQKKIKKGIAIGSGAITVASIVAGILLTPATGGASAAVVAANATKIPFAMEGITAMTSAGSTVSMTAGELAMISGLVAGALGCSTVAVMQLLKNYKVIDITTSGGTRIIFERKKSKKGTNAEKKGE